MEAVAGEFTEDGRPWVPIRINGIAMRATIDTGFNGELALPVDLAEHLGLTPITLIPVELADGSWHLMSISNGRIRIGDLEFFVEIIIGASALDRHGPPQAFQSDFRCPSWLGQVRAPRAHFLNLARGSPCQVLGLARFQGKGHGLGGGGP